MADLDDSDTPDADALTGSRVRVTESSGNNNGQIVLSVVGELDLSSEAEVRTVADRAVQHGATAFVFDLSGITFMDSSGLALLLTVAGQVDSIEVRKPSATVRRVIELSGLASTLRMTP
jgi:anti-sigma B factor antagonist